MPEERDIEKQLRAFAEQRRKDAGGRFELHAATRRLLHGERQRVRGKSAGATAPKAGLFSGFWPRLAWSVSVLAVLAVGTWAVFRSGSNRQTEMAAKPETAGYVQTLAKLDEKRLSADRADKSMPVAPAAESAPAVSAPPASTPPAPVASPAPTRVAKGAPAEPPPMTVASAKAAKAATKSPQPEPYYANSASAVNDELAANSARMGKAGPSSFGVAAAPVVMTNSASTGWAAQNAMQNEAQNIRSFSNVLPASRAQRKNAAAPDVVLNSFKLEQNGNEIRIVDGDGSVYRGAVLADTRDAEFARVMPTVAPGARAPQKDSPKEAPAAAEQKMMTQTMDQGMQAQNFRFAATGTNVSLRQRVTISAEFVPATNAPVGQAADFSNQMLKAKAQNGVWMSNGRLVGHAVTADGQQVDLNAAEVQLK